jgi:GNAT superfamily N-acetyltransferase
MVQYIRTDSQNPDFIGLVRLLDADLAIRDGEDHAFYAQFNKTHMLRHVMVAYNDGVPVACGALKPFDEQSIEVKRMYVAEDQRRKGFAKGVLMELEKWAAELGCRHLVLETGKNQPEAIGLYKNMGYEVTENYGQYIGIDNSVCFRKTL